MDGLSEKSPLLPQPLYKRAEIEMTNRIATGRWAAGSQLPNEFMLAEEFGVSQGTIRKALVAMENRGLLLRSPGRGTVICKTTPEESLYAFFRLRNEKGEMVVPTPMRESIEVAAPTARETEILGKGCEAVARLTRVRQNEQRPFVLEKMSFYAANCAGMAEDLPLPSSLYPYLHERFGLVIMTVQESITAVVARLKVRNSICCRVRASPPGGTVTVISACTTASARRGSSPGSRGTSATTVKVPGL